MSDKNDSKPSTNHLGNPTDGEAALLERFGVAHRLFIACVVRNELQRVSGRPPHAESVAVEETAQKLMLDLLDTIVRATAIGRALETVEQITGVIGARQTK